MMKWAALMYSLTADRMAAYLTKRNGGVFEPEMYLVYMIPGAIFTVGGMYPSPCTLELRSRGGSGWTADGVGL